MARKIIGKIDLTKPLLICLKCRQKFGKLDRNYLCSTCAKQREREYGQNKTPRAVWFTLHEGECIGIVLMNNGFEDKAYIGRGQGINQDDDIKFILQWGTPFPVTAAKIMCGVLV